MYNHTRTANPNELDDSIRREIEALAREAMSGLEVSDSEHLEVSEHDLARMAQVFHQAGV